MAIVEIAMFVKCVNADYEKTHSLEESVENCYKKMIAQFFYFQNLLSKGQEMRPLPERQIKTWLADKIIQNVNRKIAV